jgi:hypothetical protein
MKEIVNPKPFMSTLQEPNRLSKHNVTYRIYLPDCNNISIENQGIPAVCQGHK